MSAGTLRLHSSHPSMVSHCFYVVGRERKYLEASLISSSCILLLHVCSMWYAVGRERRYLEASLVSSFDGRLWCLRCRVSVGTLRLHSFLLAVVFFGVYVVGRERRYLEASLVPPFVGLLWCLRCRA